MDETVLQRFVELCDKNNKGMREVSKNIGKNSLFIEIFESEENRERATEDKKKILQGACSVDHMADLLCWWKTNAALFPAVTKVAIEVFGI